MCQANASGPYAPRSSRTAGSPIGSCEVSTGTPPIQQVREVARERDRCILIGSVEGPAPTPGEGHPRAPCATHDAPKAHGAHLSKEGARKQPITARGQVPLDAVEAEIPLGHVLRDRTNQHHPTRTRIATNIRHPTIEPQPDTTSERSSSGSASERAEKNTPTEDRPLGGEGPPPAPAREGVGLGAKANLLPPPAVGLPCFALPLRWGEVRVANRARK
jgi:hypothetical protein